ncbi:putative membrane protein YeiH [Clostridiales Family XIII bacterium PM5-7]
MNFIVAMEWIGTVAFAVSGAVVAIEKKLDYYGICFLAIITAIGGGIIRDILIDQPLPSALANPLYAIVSVATAAVVIFFYQKIVTWSHLVSVADGIGLAAFTAIGSSVAVTSGHDGVYVIIALAVLTGTFGGVLRDVFAQEIPRCFRREVYAVASIVGAIAFFIACDFVSMTVAMYVCFGVTLVIRLVAIFKNLHLGKVNID